jgi:hypothetical protein
VPNIEPVLLNVFDVLPKRLGVDVVPVPPIVGFNGIDVGLLKLNKGLANVLLVAVAPVLNSDGCELLKRFGVFPVLNKVLEVVPKGATEAVGFPNNDF